MLKTRILTALVLLAIVLPVLFSQSYLAISLLALAFFAAAIWESQRLFVHARPRLMAWLWSLVFATFLFKREFSGLVFLFGLCGGMWLLRFSSSLALGLPALGSPGNVLTNNLYNISIFGCFCAIVFLYQRSPQYLLSVMAIVWVADIGAYFFGKAFGRRKLAPTISPGKSWEGAFGGAFSVLILGAICVWASAELPVLQDTFVVAMQVRWGWWWLLPILLLLAAASVVGDLVESQLKRRASVKDSSGLLPGHGGVLDRIDALLPVLPLAALLDLAARLPK